MSFPKSVGQCPIYYNHPSTGRPKQTPEDVHQPYASSYIGCGNLPLYPFGHGLSYSDLVYESLTLDTEKMTKDSEIKVTVTVRNNSERAAKEVVQLYMHDLVASTVRPIQSLIAFKKVEIGAGESVNVEFTVTEPMLRFYNANCEFVSESGKFELSTGYADHLILTKTFVLE
ncbi:MAG: fibronectin type III-like domain-contianing protein, partial [Clostridia bacterium]|nr:fibronectin type III-like domain-contianing protein [Clostridia bacterium]